MSHRVGAVTDPSVSLGFRLAGLRPRVAHSVMEATRIVEAMIGEGEWGVILVQEELMPDPTPAALNRSAAGLPILVPFPGPTREHLPGEAETYVLELLRRAVGYRVRLR